MERIKNIEELRKIIGKPSSVAPLKIQKKLNESSQNFIRLSPLVMLSTSNEGDKSTISPKRGCPGCDIGSCPFVFYRDHLKSGKGK
jgi:predicted pyridoxine 5'-phosphate oxidase superfamily flavin-nucleotide-binding protein